MKLRLSIYTCMHFLVDLTCIYRLYAIVMPESGSLENWILLVVLYNFLAFALPGLVGLIADYLDSTDFLAALGCLLVSVPAWFSLPVTGIVVLQGLGNGAFHIGVGRKVLKDSNGSYTPSGIFISSGALGVFFGTVWRKEVHIVLTHGLAAVLLLCAGILLLFGKMQTNSKKSASDTPVSEFPKQSSVQMQNTTRFLSFPILMILLVVILRSFYGTAVSYDWKNTFAKSLLFALCIVAGKAFGGIAADLMGVRIASILSVGGAAVTVLFSENSMFMGCLSILLFNMTMPLTLSLLAAWWKDYPGFAFGMLMVALFLGTVPDIIGNNITLSVQGLCFISLLSLLGLLLVVYRGRKEEVL